MADHIFIRLALIDEKILFAEKKYALLLEAGESIDVLKKFLFRINNLKKEKSLYYYSLQQLKSTVAYLSPLFHKITDVEPYQVSRYYKM